MWYYVIAFGLSLIGIYLANQYFRNKFLFVFFSIIALAPGIIIAGFRFHTIGSDTDFYILPIFNQATKYFTNFTEFAEANPNTEFLYLLYTWIVTRVINESYIYLSINHLLILLPMYIAAFRLRRYLSPVMFFLIYYLIFYQESLSIVRQSIAISLSTLAFTYYASGSYKKYALFVILAFGFHSTVIVVLLYPLILWCVKKYPMSKNVKKYSIFVVAGALVVINLNLILMLLINSGLLNTKYLIYTADSDTFKGGLGVTNFVLKFMIIYFIYSFRKLNRKLLFADFAYILAIMDLFFCMFALLMAPLDRFSLYPRLMTCVTLPILFKISKQQHLNKLNIFKPILILFLMFFWYYVYMLGDFDSTSDYKMVLSLI